jgi:hypothetical protein
MMAGMSREGNAGKLDHDFPHLLIERNPGHRQGRRIGSQRIGRGRLNRQQPQRQDYR